MKATSCGRIGKIGGRNRQDGRPRHCETRATEGRQVFEARYQARADLEAAFKGKELLAWQGGRPAEKEVSAPQIVEQAPRALSAARSLGENDSFASCSFGESLFHSFTPEKSSGVLYCAYVVAESGLSPSVDGA